MNSLKEREFLKLTNVLLNTTKATIELLEDVGLQGLDLMLGDVLEKLNSFFKKVEKSFKDFIIFERYVMCAYTSEIGYGLMDIPEKVREQVWQNKDDPTTCGFTGKECKCKKSVDYLKDRFNEKIKALSVSTGMMRGASEDLKAGIKSFGEKVDVLSASAKKIMSIAELIEMIALNAYIEAARLGEEGRGFKVIADEVRKASVRTNELASEIIELIRSLQKEFTSQLKRHSKFEDDIKAIDREQTEFTQELNRDLLWMAQNFVDFIAYVRESTEEDLVLLEKVRETILSVLQDVDLTNQKTVNIHRALSILASMIDDFEEVLKGNKEVDESHKYVQSLYEEFKRIPKLRSEREIISRAEGMDLDISDDRVGQKLEDTETDIELF